jgi:single-stranded-DNA-specific exonuclease RecJ
MLQIRVREAKDESPARIDAIAKAAGISTMAASVLYRRGVCDAKSAADFIRADAFHDPFLLEGMREATERIQKAIAARRPITVYGDYDCDGVCACAILHTALSSAHADANISIYIPDRHTEGYGLNEDAVRRIATRGGVLITVDCGITNLKEVDIANTLGLDVIVTDHHQPLEATPDCVCVNPPRSPEYPCAVLSGAGIALKLVQALFGDKAMLSLIDYAAVATVADLVPLVDENRAIVKAGLSRIAANARPGLKALIEVSGISGAKISAGQIAFMLGPRINAAGRMGDAMRAFALLTATDDAQAGALAQTLDLENARRQQEEQAILREASEIVDDGAHQNRAAFAAHAGWHRGVVGIVASRLVEAYGRPSAVVSIGEDGMCTGSARGIPGVNIFRALDDCRAFLTRYGGHEQAGGFSLPLENLPGFAAAFEAHFQAYPAKVWARSVECDIQANADEITVSLAKDFEQLAPFGIGNPTPTVALLSMRLLGKAPLGKSGDHLRLGLERDGERIEALLFRAKHFDVPDIQSVCDVVGTVEADSYNGRERARFLVRALRLGVHRFAAQEDDKGGAFGYGFMKSAAHLRPHLPLSMVDEHLERSPFGLRIDVHTPKTFHQALSHWPDEASMALIDPYLGSMRACVHGRNAMVIAPSPAEDCRYPRHFRIDNDEAILAYAQALSLDRAAMAALYRHLRESARRPMAFMARCAFAAARAGHSADAAGAAIAVFEELGFLRVEPMRLDIDAAAPKRALEDSGAYRALMRMAGGEIHGG